MGTPGMIFGGIGFDRIILDDIYSILDNITIPEQQEVVRTRIDKWVLDVRCRLNVGGEILMLVEVK